MPGTASLHFEPAREEAELAEYLGSRYELARLQRYQEVLDKEAQTVGDEQELYRTSQAYLYNLTAFAMTGTKLPYLDLLTKLARAGARVLDYGCGIGSDGLMLLETGYRVEFADFDNPSVEYLRWRLARRGLDAPIHDLDANVPGGFDAAYAFDVIEHAPDPYVFLREMEQRASLVVVNLLETDEHEQELHHELPIPDLLRHVSRRHLAVYRMFHGRSHLVAYAPDHATGLARIRSAAHLMAGRFRRLRG